MRQLLADIQGSTTGVVSLYADNQGAIALAKNPVHHQRTKHIDIRYHYIREHVRSGEIKLIYVPSKKNMADMFTKALPRSSLQSFCVIS